MKKKLVELIIKAAEETDEELAEQLMKYGENTQLFGGEKGLLDSLGLVNLIVVVEEFIADEFGVSLILADDRAMSQKNSPFTTVKSLSDYIVLLLEENDSHV